jgi:sporulation protein YlmC with PRC-barrel domain
MFMVAAPIHTPMAEILAKNLSEKAVMGSDGTELGTLHNITTDLKTGKLHDLVVEPDAEASASRFDLEKDEMGRLLVPANRVQAVKDYIVIQR